mgnify:CR=1 FL=1
MDRAAVKQELQKTQSILESLQNPKPEERPYYFDGCGKMRREICAQVEQWTTYEQQLKSQL